MTITSRDVLFIVECVFYAPALVLSVYLCCRHIMRGNRAPLAWVFFFIYCLIRLAEAALGLASITYSTNIAVYSTSILFSLIGMPPLLLTTGGLLFRVWLSIVRTYPIRIKAWHFIILQFPLEGMVAVLAKGASNSTADMGDSGTYQTQTQTKLGVMGCVVGYAAMVAITGAMFWGKSHAEPTEERLLHAVTISLLLIFVRLLYAVLVTFWNSNVFESYNGNLIVLALMSVLPEIIVVIIYVVEGLTLPPLPQDQRTGKQKKQCRSQRFQWFYRNTHGAQLLDGESVVSGVRSGAQAWKDVD